MFYLSRVKGKALTQALCAWKCEHMALTKLKNRAFFASILNGNLIPYRPNKCRMNTFHTHPLSIKSDLKLNMSTIHLVMSQSVRLTFSKKRKLFGWFQRWC